MDAQSIPSVQVPRRGRRGSAAIEFGFWLPILFMMVSAVVDFGSYMNERVIAARAAMEGCRAGAVIFEAPDVDPPGSDIKVAAVDRAARVLTDLGVPCPSEDCHVTATYCPAGTNGVCRAPPFDGLLIDVTHTYTPRVGMLPVPTRIHETFFMAVENQRAGIVEGEPPAGEGGGGISGSPG